MQLSIEYGNNLVPDQRLVSDTFPSIKNKIIADAATAIRAGEIIMWENGPVMALAGDATHPDLQKKLSVIKKDRSPNQPVGWITPFGTAIGAIDLSVVTDRNMVEFLRDPNALTKRLGAVAFVRAQADMKFKHDNNIPDALIPERSDNGGPASVQIYSPVANDRCSKLVRYASLQGVMMAMTSANYHGEKEIVSYDEAVDFAENEQNMRFLPQYGKTDKPERPRGSYPVLGVMSDRFKLIRFGFLEPAITLGILNDFKVEIKETDGYAMPKHPGNVLRLQDLPASERRLMGAELHDAVVRTFMEPKTLQVQP